jgi:hypothetical protein
MTREALIAEMQDGYADGRKPDSPEPSANRSASYRHGFQMGRNDEARVPGAGAVANLYRATQALLEDERMLR